MTSVDSSCMRSGVMSTSYGCKHRDNKASLTLFTYNSTRCAGVPIEEADVESEYFPQCLEIPSEHIAQVNANSVAYDCFNRDRTPHFAREDGLIT